MKIKYHYLCFVILLFSVPVVYGQETITTGTLLDEMTDLNRLTSLPEQSYRMIQYSSYDRRSQKPGMNGWFANSDGFGDEPIPGFEKVLQAPDQTGTGTYLICDTKGPGAILRLWTAGISGKIRFFLDNTDKPVYECEAADFFWNTAVKISGREEELTSPDVFRQFDATYFPIPFSKRCRIEWIGNIEEIHFYHVGVRLYDSDVKIETFKSTDIIKYSRNLENVKTGFSKYKEMQSSESSDVVNLNLTIQGNSVMELCQLEGSKAIDYFSLKVAAMDLESALRTSILNIYFDDADVPQIQAPVGDFFGAAPGLNPYESYPFSIQEDGTMTCRFIMPFKNSVRIEIENMSEKPISISGITHFKNYDWEDGKSMHFRARWKMNHGLTASNISVMDIPYMIAHGKGRIVGTAAFLYNPSEAVTSWGNWWGEGDEKIFIDSDTFPSFFGTGSEDYFNYSWSAENFFSFPYCGQPRNDGPGNRGYVTNFRWHISDDLLFQERIAFYMELFHHGIVPDFSYGRIVYAYGIPGCMDDYIPISKRDVEMITYLNWKPLAYKGSSGYTFIQAETIMENHSAAKVEKGKLWSEGKIVIWKPQMKNDPLKFIIEKPDGGIATFTVTLAHMPLGGEITIFLNGEMVKFNDRESIDLNDPYRTFLQNHFSKAVHFKSGKNEITMKYRSQDPGKIIGVDFFWIKDK